MIEQKDLKGFIFAFLCVLAGGFLCLASGFNSGSILFSFIGLGLMGIGLLIGFIILNA
jgi:hypothetical protein